MDDKELLEKAAKAIGLKYHAYFDHPLMGKGINIGDCDSDLWNPLDNDGDALRLAVQLHFGVQTNGPKHWQTPNCTIVLFDGPVCGHRLMQQHDGDAAYATRRAIVRAAAAIAGE